MGSTDQTVVNAAGTVESHDELMPGAESIQQDRREGTNRLWRNFACCLTLAAFWIALALTGYPPGHELDDLPYIGTAMEYSQSGSLHNPHYEVVLDSLGLRLDRFYIYPPMHAFLLGCWFSWAGISTASLQAFHAILNFSFTLSSATILRRLHATWPAVVAWTLLYAYFASGFGFRPDALGYTFLSAGLAVLCIGSAWATALATFMLCMAAVCFPTTILYSAFLAPAMFWVFTRPKMSLRSLPRHVAAAGIGGGAAFAFFLWVIDGELELFWSQFTSGLRALSGGGDTWHKLGHFVHCLSVEGIATAPLLFAGLIMWGVALYLGRRNLRFVQLGTSLWIAIGVSILLCGFPIYRVFWMMFLLTGGLAAVTLSVRRLLLLRLIALAALTVLMLGHSASSIAGLLQSEPLDPAHIRSVRACVEPYCQEPCVLLLDSAAARHVFDYKLPANALTLFHTRMYRKAAFPKEAAVLREHDVDPRPASLFGRKFGSSPQRPYRFVVVVDGKRLPLPGSEADQE